MNEETNQENGLLSTAARVFKTLREILENRIELFLLELKEDRLRLFDALCWAVAAVILAMMTLVLVTFTIVVIFWYTHRLLALITITVVYGVGAIVAAAGLRSRLRRWEAFPATLEQLEKDRACFKKQN
jgi:uncharacterized membrane protein YqjE